MNEQIDRHIMELEIKAQIYVLSCFQRSIEDGMPIDKGAINNAIRESRNFHIFADKLLAFHQAYAEEKEELGSGEGNPPKMSLEEYLARKGFSSPVCDYGLDKARLPHGETARQRERRISESVKAQNEYAAQRCAAIREYREKIDQGEIIPKTAMERRLEVAQGHPDNPSTQAARRSLEKRGIDWQTGKPLAKITEREINQQPDCPSQMEDLEGTEDLEPEM